MGEERINKVKIEDLPQSESELTPEEAQRIKGGTTGQDSAAGEQKLKSDLSSRQEQESKIS